MTRGVIACRSHSTSTHLTRGTSCRCALMAHHSITGEPYCSPISLGWITAQAMAALVIYRWSWWGAARAASWRRPPPETAGRHARVSRRQERQRHSSRVVDAVVARRALTDRLWDVADPAKLVKAAEPRGAVPTRKRRSDRKAILLNHLAERIFLA